MSGSIQAKRERRNALAKQSRDILDKTPADKRMSNEDSEKCDALIAEIGAIDGEIAREQKLLDLTAEQKFTAVGGEIKDIKVSDARKIYQKWLRGGDKSLSAEDFTVIRNTMSTTTGSEGGFSVQSDVATELIESLKDFGGMRRTSEVFKTEKGNPLSFPTTDGTAEVGEIVAENGAAASADVSFNTVALPTYKYSSKVVTVPLELIQDSMIDVEALVRNRLRDRLGRITNQHYTTGTGTGQPFGLVTRAAAGFTFPTGNTTSYTYDGIVDLFHSVDPAYRMSPRAGFMTSDGGIKALRKVKDTQNRPVFVPGYETTIPGASGSAPDTLLGAKLQVNNDIAVPAANAKSIVYGDLSKYKIRDAMDIVIFRFFDSPYIKNGQVGFLAWMRSGGNLVDTAAVKYGQNSAT